MSSFNRRQEAVLDSASAIDVQAAFNSLSPNFNNNLWLAQNNKYAMGNMRIVENDYKRNRLVQKDIVEYIAASVLTHCFDGWAYLGRAVGAHLRGDSDTARHLGYYAELRAAMSILAAQGVGVFNNFHFVVTSQANCSYVPIDSGTHQFTWEALKYWSKKIDAGRFLFKIIAPFNIPLHDWMDYLSPGSYGGLTFDIAKKWLQQWGLDLERLSKDRNSRNMSSYRPTPFISSRALPPRETVSFASDIWHSCAPYPTKTFSSLDEYLLSQVLKYVFINDRETRTGSRRFGQAAQNDFVKKLSLMLNGINLLSVDKGQLISTLSSFVKPNIIRHSKGKLLPFDAGHHLEVLARATLLLRFASASSQYLFKNSTLTKQDIEFWLSVVGEDRCLWPHDNEPDDLYDLWEDQGDGIDEINRFMKGKNYSCSYKELWDGASHGLSRLSSCESICLLGFDL